MHVRTMTTAIEPTRQLLPTILRAVRPQGFRTDSKKIRNEMTPRRIKNMR
jgi:hypothetical protein